MRQVRGEYHPLTMLRTSLLRQSMSESRGVFAATSESGAVVDVEERRKTHPDPPQVLAASFVRDSHGFTSSFF